MEESPDPAGFGFCGKCFHFKIATAEFCYECTKKTFPTPPSNHCDTCSQPLEVGKTCGNPVCHWGTGERFFKHCYSVSTRSGVLEQVINGYKYREERGWAPILGRILSGHLISNCEVFDTFNLVVGSPTYVSSDGRRQWDHIHQIIETASESCKVGAWEFDLAIPGAIIQSAETERFVGKTWGQRRDIAVDHLRKALIIPDVGRTRNRNILIFDDVFTDGLRMNEVARALIFRGEASLVCGIVLARQPSSGSIVGVPSGTEIISP